MTEPEAYLTTDEVAAVMRVAPITARRLCASGQLPATKVGRKSWRIARSALDAYMAPTNIPTPVVSSAGEQDVAVFETAAERRAARRAS